MTMPGAMLVSLVASMTPAPAVSVMPIPAPPRPPVMVTPVPRSFSNRPGVTQTIAVQVRQDGRVLWAGDLSRSSKGTASFNQQLRESKACGAADNGRFATGEFESSGLSVSITPDYQTMLADDSDADGRVQITVERTRPYGDGDVCTGGRGSSTVRFGSAVRLEHGHATTVAGEGGLSVVLTLR
jgi:hypothetical protein